MKYIKAAGTLITPALLEAIGYIQNNVYNNNFTPASETMCVHAQCMSGTPLTPNTVRTIFM